MKRLLLATVLMGCATEAKVDSVASPLTVSGYTVITGEVAYASVTIEPGGVLAFDPTADTHLTVTGNIVVQGTLRMEPIRRNVEHRITFDDVDETEFVGGGTSVLETDVGLWVIDNGRLDIHGDPVTSWTRDPNSAIGWEEGEIRVAPTTGSTSFPLWTGGALPTGAAGLDTEAFNLTRNVVIEGTPTGRAHVMIMADVPQSIWYAEFRHLGPQLADGENGVAGRYPLHFHHCGDGSRGSRIEGVSVHSVSNHAIVTHASHGIRIANTIMYDVQEHAFWWDPETENASDDVELDRVMAAFVYDVPANAGQRLRGFHLAEGFGNSIHDSVAVGVQGSKDAAGFAWASHNASLSSWEFRDNVSHNNKIGGLFTWQNTAAVHLIEDSIVYSNGDVGINHGAYINSYEYRNVQLVDNPLGIRVHAASNAETMTTPRLTFDQVTINDATVDVDFVKHSSAGGAPTRFVDCGDLSSVELNESQNNGVHPTKADFVRCGLEPADFDTTGALPGFIVRVQRTDGTAYQIDDSGVSVIAAFE